MYAFVYSAHDTPFGALLGGVTLPRLAGLAKAPVEVQKEHQAALKGLKKRAVELDQELQFIEQCHAGVAQRERAKELP